MKKHDFKPVFLLGWYASDSSCVVQTGVYYSATNAAMLPIDNGTLPAAINGISD